MLKRFKKKITGTVHGEFVNIFDEPYYQIQNYDHTPPFFMSLVSSSNHWFFISSTGGLTAGRVNKDQALFPYYTEDKLTENGENTGSKTILIVSRDSKKWLWEPFSIRQQGLYQVQRNLYKNLLGTTLIFEEINISLQMVYRYAWSTGDRFGFIKTSWLKNTGKPCTVDVLDGIQNILPAYTLFQVQTTLSCLLDAYKRSELDTETGLGIFTLNSTLTDLAEPSESLLATTAFQVGLPASELLLSSIQLDSFRTGTPLLPESSKRGKRGAFFVRSSLDLHPEEEKSWYLVADVQQDASQVVSTKKILQKEPSAISKELQEDVARNQDRLREIMFKADGIQYSANLLNTAHHLANVMFNVMRGGVFPDHYDIDKKDFLQFMAVRNLELLKDQTDFFEKLPDRFTVFELRSLARSTDQPDLHRLANAYMPLFFSRRHGDPSRPWNEFTINIRNPDGTDRLDYQGNWRDIFQNWEALAFAYPEYVESMIFTFLNATTADGYNAYRITREGIEWEKPEPGNPWANIGYWSDHQIIYLQKLLEISTHIHPGYLQNQLNDRIFSSANVPYRIKPYQDLIRDPYSSIIFDEQLDNNITARVKKIGSDGKLVHDDHGNVLYRSLTEKLLVLLLAKLVNFVPEGGIWMNTQRPEWNDANNALVGKGLSVVTLGYLYRFVEFFIRLLRAVNDSYLEISTQVFNLFADIKDVLTQNQAGLKGSFENLARRKLLDALGQAGSAYRENFYTNGLSEEFSQVSTTDLLDFLEKTRRYIAHSLAANRRGDNLFHAYNILHLGDDTASIGRLDEMLEGQVSILSSGFLNGRDSLALLESLRSSRLYRSDQNSYILYPDKDLPGFLEKNSLNNEHLRGLRLPLILVQSKDASLFIQDENGVFHFNGSIHNQKDVRRLLADLGSNPHYKELVTAEGERILDLFEEVFRHNEFTGRSGTFFAYEGLGSVYWHMVSKLLLAVQETAFRFQHEDISADLLQKYREIRAGFGFNKSPSEYGAFPTDPYSHTPLGQGARQPGMTGTVKEEILTRLGEVCLSIENGCIVFHPLFLDKSELIKDPFRFSYRDVSDQERELNLPPGSLVYMFCQVPVILSLGAESEISIHFRDGKVQTIPGDRIDPLNSSHIFKRSGLVDHLDVTTVAENGNK